MAVDLIAWGRLPHLAGLVLWLLARPAWAGSFEPLWPPGNVPSPQVGQADPPGRDFLRTLFPVHTPTMSPGRLTTRKSRLPDGWQGRPLAIVGDDRPSWQWLRTHASRLRQLGAQVLVADVASVDRFMAMARAFPGLHLAPAPATELARAFRLTHWPVLISREWIEQ